MNIGSYRCLGCNPLFAPLDLAEPAETRRLNRKYLQSRILVVFGRYFSWYAFHLMFTGLRTELLTAPTFRNAYRAATLTERLPGIPEPAWLVSATPG